MSKYIIIQISDKESGDVNWIGLTGSVTLIEATFNTIFDYEFHPDDGSSSIFVLKDEIEALPPPVDIFMDILKK